MNNVLSDYRDLLFNPIPTHNVILIADEHFKKNMVAGEVLKIYIIIQLLLLHLKEAYFILILTNTPTRA